MIRIVKKSTLNEMRDVVLKLDDDLQHANRMYKDLKNDYDKLYKSYGDKEIDFNSLLDDYREVLQQLKDVQTLAEEKQAIIDKMNSDKNRVTLVIHDDMTSITPFVASTDDAFEKLFQVGMVDDTQQGNRPAIELALMTIAHESLEQIINQFVQPVKDD